MVNPVSGGGAAKRQWSAVTEELARLGYAEVQVVESESSEHATRAGADSARRGSVTVAVGGDGHVRDVAEGVLSVPGASLGIAPAGRGNDLTRHLGIPHDPVGIAAVIAGGTTRHIDVLDVARPDGGTSIAVGNVYAGLDSVATELINGLRWMGPIAYRVAPVLAALRWKPVDVTLTVDGERRNVQAHMVVIANSGDYGHGLRVVPSASVDSGDLQIMLLHGNRSKYRLASLMKQAKTGAHVSRSEVEILTATSSVEAAFGRAVPVHADGDYLCDPPVTVKIRPGALPILVP
ncbi:diacylglycerol kinase family lipid kinase [Gordonia sp. HY002]|uniref:diacylglycerol/lipid kinase family protein n=1 Tax=Gordonia zhenghanii TaxID=2911516 RepID=UPI001EF01795|nr:diacylglycerol kinase family protein [Gordonia zhenghanii]MCF8571990.1 diacylglycerol kinase family lipid kinase [Gordonia zhenghanii]MCF8604208.1 diacylglycerol kinase family lipid kinase [Gordonia zhenghanii]